MKMINCVSDQIFLRFVRFDVGEEKRVNNLHQEEGSINPEGMVYHLKLFVAAHIWRSCQKLLLCSKIFAQF